MQGGKATAVEIGTVTGPVYIQDSSAKPDSGAEDLRQPVIETSRFEPETVLIPAGPFLMGSDDPAASASERPQHEVELSDFRIGRYPVTILQYAAFIKDKKDQNPPRKWFNRKPPQDRLDHPMTDVSWHDAEAYCAWLRQETGRPYTLPSEAEWEKAASWDPGLGEKRKHPWGNEWLDGRCAAGSRSTTAVNACQEGASAYWVEDLLGNVQEWTRSLWGSQPAQPEFGYPYDPADGREIMAPEDLPPQGRLVHRGGSIKSDRAYLRCTARGNSLADSNVAWRGLRVAMTIE
jgi:formylglycine-generating enzyme required for sulfatase activity